MPPNAKRQSLMDRLRDAARRLQEELGPLLRPLPQPRPVPIRPQPARRRRRGG